MTMPRSLAAVLVSVALLGGGAALAPAASAAPKPAAGHLRTVVAVKTPQTAVKADGHLRSVSAGHLRSVSAGHLRSISAGHLR
ncbi:hypothetical protein FHR75_002075 [Kineococcus radiotolerans]|uniref:Uncharacterized protein n=1 Tax=Kineococcus radiotolerans TaxID=131568 RepID=A0A7W4TMN1_KINRA|nr:hypothetical protein [Kineococcus radiotolerans]MBB2901287.1 hypothetical protein [Kineococcus radiotolerans]